eukprot:GHVO01006432.1.p1 GENE.GHVO01006432.1~~GHVO01006432.1.p1  ORF type:complete len:104 (-),score=14.82 GHVO01006432.1:267-554(-)
MKKKKDDVERCRRVEREITLKETQLLRLNLETHYKRMAQFIRTRAEPTIFWMPAEHNERTQLLQDETAAQIESKIKHLVTHLPEATVEEKEEAAA